MTLERMRLLATGATAGIGLACVEAALAARLGSRARFLRATPSHRALSRAPA